eukprot:TRINITY_DN70985_c0_g1_i1.p1 TRINITY_DN70985_c0_g1~~TRINITY_DN70985_c0_g1_i1.p1  ORF type:complete len:212 (-),score=9.97 TRINITY_DN70985_c0_g1_i1:98-733(-)
MELRRSPTGFAPMPTKPCWYFPRGQCSRGEVCRFAHGDEEIALPRRRRSNTVCRHWSRGLCRLGNTCMFSHTALTGRTEGELSSTWPRQSRSGEQEVAAAVRTAPPSSRAAVPLLPHIDRVSEVATVAMGGSSDGGRTTPAPSIDMASEMTPPGSPMASENTLRGELHGEFGKRDDGWLVTITNTFVHVYEEEEEEADFPNARNRSTSAAR